MNRLLKQLLAAYACLLALTVQALADPLSDAQRAFDQGDYAKAASLYKPLAANGDAVAQFKLGALYYNGKGVARNRAKAEKLYRSAAEQGHAPAQSNLATMYYTGNSVRRDFVLAHMWKNIAAANAEGERQKRYREQLAELEKSMTKKQISQARALAKKCTANKFKRCKR